MTQDLLTTRLATIPDRETRTQLQKRREWLATAATIADERASTTWPRIEARRQAEDIAKTKLLRVEEAARDGTASPSDVAEAKAALKRERETTAKQQPEILQPQQDAEDVKSVLGACTRYLNGLNWPTTKKSSLVHQQTSDDAKHFRGDPWEIEGSVPNIRLAPVKLSGNADLRAIVNDQRAEGDRLREELADLPYIEEDIDTAKARNREWVEDNAARGAPTVHFADILKGGDVVHVEARASFPSVAIGAAPASDKEAGFRPRVVDAAALACWLAPDKVLAALNTATDELYLGVDAMMNPHEKSRRARELEAAILKAERLECAALWALVEAGDESLRFRPGTDPRAILGIG